MNEKLEDEKWSTLKFLKGLFFNKYFLGFSSWFFFSYTVLHWNNQSDNIKTLTLLVFGVVTIVWMLSEAWKKFIENGNLNVEAKVGLNKDIKTEKSNGGQK